MRDSEFIIIYAVIFHKFPRLSISNTYKKDSQKILYTYVMMYIMLLLCFKRQRTLLH